jgi:hypothetical protein
MFAARSYKNYGVSSDPFFRNTSLLLHGDGTNGAQNNTFLDSSSTPKTITRNGTPTQGSFTPYGNLWSNSFDGTDDRLTLPSNAAFAFGTDNFTIEFWANSRDVLGTTQRGFLQTSDVVGGLKTSYTTGVAIGQGANASGGMLTGGLWANIAGTLIGSNTPVLATNAWYHIAFVRSSGVVTIYVNGSVHASGTANGNCFGTNLCVGGYYDTSYLYNGFLSNLRIVKGTAVYTSTFTPPTSPLTAIAGTSLLTCQSNRFVDNSSNNFAITINGNVSISTEAPFNPTSEYSITTDGGSGYFPGINSNYLSVPSNASFNFASGTFTVESWCMTTNASAIQTTFTNYNSASTGWGIQIYLNKFIAIFSGDTVDIQGTTTVLPNVWYHVAISGSAGSYKLFVNGVQEGNTYTGATSLAGGILGIGAIGDGIGSVGVYPMVGYISNARIVNGRACYTSNFTPPTSPVTLLSNGGATPSTAPTSGQVSLLCDFTNAGIFDNTKKNNLVTVGTARVSTAEKKFGTGSMLFNGSTDYLSTINKQDLSLGSGNFTIECWVYANSIGSFNGVFAQWPNNGGSVNNSFVLESVGSSMQFYWCAGSTIFGPATLGTITTGSWIHYAICRSGNTLYPFKNGILGTTVSITQTLNSPTSNITVGGLVAGSGYWNGYIDDLRITKGVARYTANFTPPTQAFPNQ